MRFKRVGLSWQKCAGMTPQKEEFANGDKPASLAEVIKDADVFCGLSTADIPQRGNGENADGKGSVHLPWRIQIRKSDMNWQEAHDPMRS